MNKKLRAVFAALLMFSSGLVAAPPANDHFANRAVLSVGTVIGTTAESSAEYGIGEPYPGSGDQRTVWYQLNIPAGQKARLTLTPGSAARDIRLIAYTGTDYSDLVSQFATSEEEGLADRFVFSNTSAGVLTMFIQIDSPNADAGAFQLATAFDTAGPVNDNFAARTVLAAGAVNGTCMDATPEVGEIPFSGDSQALSVWYEVTIPAGQNLRLSFVNQTPGADFILPFFTGTDFASLTQIGILNPDLGASRLVNRSNTGASPLTYVFAVEPQLAFGENGGFQIITSFDTGNPANDNLAAAAALTSGNLVTGSNGNATTEPTEGFEPFGTVWYTVTVPSNQQALITVTPAGFDANVLAYTGTTFANLFPVAYGQNAGSGGTEYFVLRNTLGGARTFRISVDGATHNASGAFDIRADISAIGPANDDIVARQNLDAGNTANGTTVNATPESGEPAHAGSPAVKSVWYTVAINPGQQGVFTFTPSGFDLRAGFYDMDFSGVTPATIASVNAAGSGGVETVTIPNYQASPLFLYVAVDSVTGGSGAFTFGFQQEPAPLLNDSFANAIASSATFGSFNADTTNATAEPGEPQIDGNSPKSVWFRLTAPQTGKLDLSIRSSIGGDAKFAVFSGSAVGSLSVLSNYAMQRKVLVTAGQTLYVAVATPAGQQAQAGLGFSFGDAFPGEFSFNTVTAVAFEDNESVTITLVRFSGADGAATVPFTLSPGSASTDDYVGVSGQFAFPDDENIAEVTIPIVNDGFPEPDETFTLTLGTPSSGTLGANKAVTITIQDPEDTGGGGGSDADLPFRIPRGTFTGLMNSGFAQTGFGLVQITTAGSKVTGKLLVDGLSVPFKGAFTESEFEANVALNLKAKRGKAVLNFALNLKLESDDAHFSGTLTGLSPAPYLVAGERNAVGSAALPVPRAGTYNALLTGDVGGSAVHGITRITVKPTGAVSLLGALPDGAKFSAGSQSSIFGKLYFAAGLYKREALKTSGYFTGAFDLDPAVIPKSVTGITRWNRPPNTPKINNGKIYPGGVANAPLTVAGALYTRPGNGQRALADFNANGGAATATLSGGNLGAPIVKAITVDTKNTVTVSAPGADKLKLTIASATGLITGSFVHSDGRPRAIAGILVQSTPGFAQGMFPGTDEAGILTISP